MVGDAAVVVVVLAGIDRAAFFPAEEVRNEGIFLGLHDNDLAGLSRGERVYHRLVLLGNFELLTALLGVGSELDEELVDCLWV